MRLSCLLMATFLVVYLVPTCSYAQGGEQRRSEEQPEPYRKHHDTRHGHDHFYPDRGAIVRDLPRGTIGVNYADVSYRYYDGIWLEPRGPAFIVVAPPIGIVVPTPPTFSTTLAQGKETYLYANDTYYQSKPDLGGYEVVNEPAEGLPKTGPDTLVGGPLPGAASVTSAAATPATASQLATPSAMIATGIPTSVQGAVATPSIPAQAATGPTVTQAATVPAVAQAATGPTVAQTSAFPPSAATSAPAMAAAVQVTQPAPASASVFPQGPKVFLYPKNGQTPDQQARDRYECYRFAVGQSGFDPTRASGSSNELLSDYERAQSACFDARGYASR